LTIRRNPSFLYLVLTLLTIIGVMEVIFLMTYRKPSDGAIWRETEQGLEVASLLRDVETPLQVGDQLRQMDDQAVGDLQTYEDVLFTYPIGSKHLYAVIREDSFFEPWVTISGVRERPEAYFFFAVSGFIFLLFAFLIVGQNVPIQDQRHMSFLSICLYCSFIFYRTDLLAPMDWVAFILNLVGITFLGSCFFDAILRKTSNWKFGFFSVKFLHWLISFLVLAAIVLFLVGGRRLRWFEAYEFTDLLKVQQIWNLALFAIGLGVSSLYKPVKKLWGNLLWAWFFSFIPLMVYFLNLDFPFDAVVAATFPAMLPVVLFFEWNRAYRMFLAGAGRQIVVYASILLVLFLGFFIFLGSFYQLMGGRMSSETQLFLSSFGMVLAAIAFSPLKVVSENFWNKVVYGERLDALKNLMDVALINRADTSLTEFFEVILQKIQTGFGVQTAHAYIYNRIRESFFEVTGTQVPVGPIEFPEGSDEVMTCKQVGIPSGAPFHDGDLIRPMRINDEVIAFLHMSNGEEPIQLSHEEKRLLKNFVNHCEVLLENIELYRDAQEKAQRIEKLREFNESIIESSQVGMVAVDEMGLIVSCNQAFVEITGVDVEDPVGLRFHYLLREEHIEREYQGKNGQVIEGEYKTPMGQHCLLELQKTPLKSKDNAVYGTLYLVEDIQEKKKVQEKMIQQEKLASIGLLAAGVAHEINTPLTGIQSYAQMLNQESLKEDQNELVEQVLQQSHRAGRIVRELLDFSRKDNTLVEAIELKHVIEQAITLMSHSFKKSQVEYVLELPAEDVQIKGNSNQLQQVFINLMVNAIDAMEPGGKLIIRVGISEKQVLATLQDDGAGMDPQTVNRIFDPFFTTKEAGKGTGLGLSMVYNILREHNAEISVESTIEVGTSIHIKFPRTGR